MNNLILKLKSLNRSVSNQRFEAHKSLICDVAVGYTGVQCSKIEDFWHVKMEHFSTKTGGLHENNKL